MFNKIFFLILCGFSVISTQVFAQFSDRVLVIINEDVITQSEFDHRWKTVRADLQQKGVTEIPPNLPSQVLDGMISDRLQIQEAARRGIQVTDNELVLAMQRFAQQQQMTPQQLQFDMEQQGQSYGRFVETVRDSITLSRLTEFYAQSRVIVPDYEIDGFIAVNNLGEVSSEYNVAQLLIGNSSHDRQYAENVRQEILDGLSFQQAVLKYSEATNAQEGGVLGWRTLANMPEIYQQGLKEVSVGGISEVLEGDNGFHILKLLDLKGDRTEIVQADVRHILISATSTIAKSQATKRMFEIRQRIIDGEDFSQLARIYSDDSVSAAEGGGLGWVSPGDMVANFEQVYKQLPLNQVSQPFSTQYGVHILEVVDRRQKNITDQMVRQRAENILRRQRAEREFEQWVRQLKEQAYIEKVASPV